MIKRLKRIAEEEQNMMLEHLKRIDGKLRAKGFTPQSELNEAGGTWEKEYDGMRAVCKVEQKGVPYKWQLTYNIWSHDWDLEEVETAIDHMEI